MANKDKIRSNYVKLSWWILEQKLKYYYPEYGVAVSDEKYDKNEALYKKICKALEVPTTASDYVGFPFDTASGRLVLEKAKLELK